MRCECPEDATAPSSMLLFYRPEEYAGMNHKANECQGTFELAEYLRGDKTLWLCSCCCMPDDLLLRGPVND